MTQPLKLNLDTSTSSDAISPRRHQPPQRSSKGSSPGRPATRLSPRVIREILERVAGGESLRKVLPDEGRDSHLPSRSTFMRAVVDDRPAGISAQYARAREALALHWADEIVGIADDAAPDMVALAVARQRIEVRKWMLAKVLPKLFGDRLQLATEPSAAPYPVVVLPALNPRPSAGET